MDDATQPDATTTDAARHAPSRRAVLGAAAWAAPVVVVASATPAFAASGESLNRTTPATPTFSADQNSTSQTLAVTLTGPNGPVPGRAIAFSASGSTSTDWLTFTSGGSATTDTAGLATVDLVYGTPKPAAGSTFTITAIDPSDPSLAVSWTLTYVASAAPIPQLVVVRVGAGTALPANGTSVATFLDQFSPETPGAATATTPLPTATGTGGNRRLTISASGTSEGALARSGDGRYLTLAGYDAAPGTANVNSTAAAAPRTVARVDAAGVVDTTTALTSDTFGNNNVRGAATQDGTGFWVVGAGTGGGTRYAPLGATASTLVSSAPTNVRTAQVFAGQLYVSSASSPNVGVNTVGTGLPTTSGQTTTLIAAATAPYGFVLLDRSTAVDGLDTLYVADDGAGIRKYYLNGSTWTAVGSSYQPASGVNVRGITGIVREGVTTLFVTGTDNKLYRVVDSAAYNAALSGTSTVLATAAANTVFRGVAFAPTA